MPNNIDITVKTVKPSPFAIQIAYANGATQGIELKLPCPLKFNIEFGNIGPKGDPGEGATLSAPAGEIINGDSLVMLKNGKVFKNIPNDENAYLCVGFAKNAAVIDEMVSISISGEHTSAGMGLLQGMIYYAGVNGGITAIPPVVGISQVVGVAKDVNTIFVDINEPFIMI